MSVRTQLADALRGVLPANMKIIDVPRSIDGMETRRPVVLLYRERMTKAPNAIGDYFNEIALWVISPNIDPKRGEELLDDSLDDVIVALDSINWVNWSLAERSVFGDAQAPAYKITVTLVSNKE